MPQFNYQANVKLGVVVIDALITLCPEIDFSHNKSGQPTLTKGVGSRELSESLDSSLGHSVV